MRLPGFVSTLPLYFLQPIVYALLLTASSCKYKIDYSKEISGLDSTMVKLKEIEKVFLSVDTNQVRMYYDFNQDKLNFSSEKISGDTIVKNTAIFLSDAYGYTINLRNLLENKKFLEQALREAAQRINDLKHDLTEGLIEKNKSYEYIVNELNASDKIYETVSKIVEKAQKSMRKLDSLKTKTISLADSLQSK